MSKVSRRLTPNFILLQTFECAARHGSFTAAAVELNLTQSAISRHIKQLEEQLDVTLFERVRRRVHLSEAGHRFLPKVRQLLNRSENTMMQIMASTRSVSHLSIATLPTFGTRWLVPRLAGFLQEHPGTTLNLSSRSSPFDFTEHPFDMAIHYGRPVWAHANCDFLCREQVVAVANPHLHAQYAAQPHDLRVAPLIHHGSRPRAWAEWFQSRDMAADNAYRGHYFDQFSMIISAAVVGLGVALLPKYLIESELESNALKVLDEVPLPTENSYFLVKPEGMGLNVAVESFCAWIKRQVSRSNAT